VRGIVNEYYQLVRQQYRRRDSVKLLRTIMTIAREIGLERALSLLERCVTEKRLAWLDERLATLERTGDPIADGYKAFYEAYLGILPQYGEIVNVTPNRMVTRWWNPCPILEACKALGVDTRIVCKRAYHKPVDAFLARIDPRLRFERDYDAIRPHTPYCEETILLAE
jgi:hypothetical protein